jgi:hypothetical protein
VILSGSSSVPVWLAMMLGSGDEVLAALAASLRAELAGSQAALARAVEELA